MLDNLYDYTSQMYNKDGTSNSFMPTNSPLYQKDEDQRAQEYLDSLNKKKTDDFQNNYFSQGSGGGGGSALHQIGTSAAMAGASALAGGGGAGGAMSAILGSI